MVVVDDGGSCTLARLAHIHRTARPVCEQPAPNAAKHGKNFARRDQHFPFTPTRSLMGHTHTLSDPNSPLQSQHEGGGFDGGSQELMPKDPRDFPSSDSLNYGYQQEQQQQQQQQQQRGAPVGREIHAAATA